MIHYFPNAKRWAHRAIHTKEIHNIVSKIVSDAKYQVHLFHVGNLRKNFSQIQFTYVKNVKLKCLQVTTFVWSHPSPKALVTSLVAFIVVPLQETLETNIRGVPRWSRWCKKKKNSLATCSLLTQVVAIVRIINMINLHVTLLHFSSILWLCCFVCHSHGDEGPYI